MDSKIAEKIRNQQQVAKSVLALRQLELDKTDVIQQTDRLKEEVSNLDIEMITSKSEAERKKRDLAQKADEAKRAETRVHMGHGSAKDQQVIKAERSSTLTDMYEISTIDREFVQKQRETEQKKTDAKRKLVELERKRYQLERQFDEETNTKRAADAGTWSER